MSLHFRTKEFVSVYINTIKVALNTAGTEILSNRTNGNNSNRIYKANFLSGGNLNVLYSENYKRANKEDKG